MRKKVKVLQHISCETIGMIEPLLNEKGISFEVIHSYKGDPVPESLDEAGGLIVMGGPMGVYETEAHPYLLKELKLIEQTLKEEKPVLGICLGSQLLASALGAPVKKGPRKEIGWIPVKLKEAALKESLFAGVDPVFTPLHWHGDIFDLPERAVSLASSELTEHQAFRYGADAYGILFHLEILEKNLGEWVRVFKDEINQEGLQAESILSQGRENISSLHQTGKKVFSRWIDSVNKIFA